MKKILFILFFWLLSSQQFAVGGTPIQIKRTDSIGNSRPMVTDISVELEGNTETPVKMPETTQAQTIDKVPWIPIIGGIVYVLVHVTEGQYYKEVTYNPDGSVASIKEGCKGLGSCSVRGEKQNASGGFTSISSVVYGDDYDYSGEAQLIKTKDGKILLKMSNEPNNEACYQNFFYDNIIEISRPWIIDDYEVLDKLERLYDNAITVQGKYEVFTLEDGKYIIIG